MCPSLQLAVPGKHWEFPSAIETQDNKIKIWLMTLLVELVTEKVGGVWKPAD